MNLAFTARRTVALGVTVMEAATAPSHGYTYDWISKSLRLAAFCGMAIALVRAPARAQVSAIFHLAPDGCSMAHCNPVLNNAIQIIPPLTSVTQIAHDALPSGSLTALGASSNGRTVAAVYSGDTPPYLKVYNGATDSFSLKWSSSTLDGLAFSCTPMMGTDGGVISCDDTQIIRWDQSGNVLWATCYYGGTPPSGPAGGGGGSCTCPDGVSLPPCGSANPSRAYTHPSSPVQLADGTIVIAGFGTSGHKAPLFQFNSSSGKIMAGPTYLNASKTDSYVTTNALCAVGTRIFDITQWSADASLGRMYAIDVADGKFTPAWTADIQGPSNASPLCTNGNVYTDGVAANPVLGALHGWQQSDGKPVYACLSSSTCPPLPAIAKSNFALDPRGGYWTYAASYLIHKLERRSTVDGHILQAIDTNIVPGETCDTSPASAMSMTSDGAGHSILITEIQAAPSCDGNAYIVAIDVNTGTLKWSWLMPAGAGDTRAQFPVVVNAVGLPRVAFTTDLSGVYLIGAR